MSVETDETCSSTIGYTVSNNVHAYSAHLVKYCSYDERSDVNYTVLLTLQVQISFCLGFEG